MTYRGRFTLHMEKEILGRLARSPEQTGLSRFTSRGIDDDPHWSSGRYREVSLRTDTPRVSTGTITETVIMAINRIWVWRSQ